MPAKSKAQQRAAGAALSAKRGDSPKNKLKGPSKQMAESMSEKQLSDLASTGRKKLPRRADSGSKSSSKKSATKKSGSKKSSSKKSSSKSSGKKSR